MLWQIEINDKLDTLHIDKSINCVLQYFIFQTFIGRNHSKKQRPFVHTFSFILSIIHSFIHFVFIFANLELFKYIFFLNCIFKNLTILLQVCEFLLDLDSVAGEGFGINLVDTLMGETGTRFKLPQEYQPKWTDFTKY